ncbi:Ni/Fe hydrogenase subunit alpha [Trichlorobacter lovleyi]|uniref:Nickel-dependent hydrogenase large subunit n=1 Tax=Trichlorobacter lovleyi (strain ATCC BAA-1151 / DSM 17278 / SZ) TaxID=398767 RepID=B3E9J3_TRIL1|nr:Ni/Fe hydrogenase subunit alpha [Trichlorobacter lovleyi]ACD95269.1 nickel-dependent hydrogenase large subunit [Trichlorobacter lovleyi SZ]
MSAQTETPNSRTIRIDPVTRIEGHAKVFVNLAEDGSLDNAGLVVNELRGFEKILVGMEANRMPHITARICGVCPTAHHIAASNALDHACGVVAPPAAMLLRELMYMGHIIHSHALSLFVLQGPDLVLGLDADPAIRNVVGIVQANPEVAKKALRIRTVGQRLNEIVGGRGTHPVTSVAGGITFVLDSEKRAMLQSLVDEGKQLAKDLAPVVKQLVVTMLERHPAMLTDWVAPSWSVGTVLDNRVSLIQGNIRAVDENGITQVEFPVQDYDKYMVESVVDFSYMKRVGFKKGGLLHDYRVGPLARINAMQQFSTEWANREMEEMLKLGGYPCHITLFQAYAKLVEMIWAIERADDILRDPAVNGETRVPVKFQGGRAVGHSEAPRGTLIHDYEIDEDGIVRAANLIVATQQNYAIINRSIEHAAKSHVIGKSDDQALLNAIEFSIRCYDPCLSCATHAVGAMPMEISINRGGRTVKTIRR